MTTKNRPPTEVDESDQETIDQVLEASLESFPASDPPTWTPVRGPKATPVEQKPGGVDDSQRIRRRAVAASTHGSTD